MYCNGNCVYNTAWKVPSDIVSVHSTVWDTNLLFISQSVRCLHPDKHKMPTSWYSVYISNTAQDAYLLIERFVHNTAWDSYLLIWWLYIKHSTRCLPPDIETFYITQHKILTSWCSDCISNTTEDSYLLIWRLLLLLLLYQGLEPMLRIHCSNRLIVQPWSPPLYVDVPTFAARCLHVLHDARDPSSERWNFVDENDPVILPKCRLPRTFRELLHAVNLRHGTGGFTSPPKDFSPLKILTASAGFEPANLGT
jgi:hypothetical protein